MNYFAQMKFSEMKNGGLVKIYKLIIWTCFAILGFSFTACKTEKIEIGSLFSRSEDLGEVAENVDIYYSEKGVVQLRIKGPKLIRTNAQGKQKDIFPEGLEVTFFDANGNERSWLSAKHGERYPIDQKIILTDSVVFKNIEEETLRTSELTWYESDGSMESNKFVEIRRPGELIRGFGFKAKENLSIFELQAVTGRLKAGEITDDFE
jgi:LPS export ABC transporter protein LptC